MNVSKIMIVDDSEDDQFLTEMRIKNFDDKIEICQAYDGEEAMEMLGSMEKQPDVILLDINMPRMNGLEFLEVYNKTENPSAVVTMLTSSDQNKDKQAALAYGCVKRYFVKLLKSKDLEEMLEM